MSVFKNKHLYIIFANTICGIMGVSLIVPDLPVIARQFGVSHQNIGLVLTMLTLPGTLFVLFLGILADRIGRKALMLPSLVIFSLAGGSIYWADSFLTMNILRFVQGFGAAILPTMSIMLIGDHFGEKDRLKVMGLNGAALSIGTALFPFVGGILASIDWRTPFLGYFLVLPVAFWVAVSYREPSVHKPAGVRITGYLLSSALHMTRRGIVMAYAMALFIFILLYGGILTYLTLYMDHRFGMSTFQIGLYIAASSFASALLAPFAYKLEKRLGRRAMFGAGFFFFAACFLSIVLVEQRQWLIGSIMLFGLAMGLTIPLLQNIVTELAPVEHRGIMTAMLAMLTRLGQTIGPPLLAIFIIGDSMLPVFIVCGIAAALFSAAAAGLGRYLKAREQA